MNSDMRSRLLRRAAPAGLILLAVFLDMLTKFLVVEHLKPIGTFPIIEGVFHFTYRTNTGAAWSLFSAPDQRWIFMTVSSVAIVAMLLYLFFCRIKSNFVLFGMASVIGGGIGNMIDRLRLGYVVDFLDARIINFPVFNVADSFVCVGAFALCLGLVIEWVQEGKAARQAALEEEEEDKKDGEDNRS